MTIAEIYEKYSTPINLREHMLRVAALSKIILENWTGAHINSKTVIVACALHDIAKPVNFDIKQQMEYGVSDADINDLESLQKLIKTKYGTDEHKASVDMCRDVGVDIESLEILENIEWNLVPGLVSREFWGALVGIYCDMRVGPFGILSLNERIKNLSERRGSEKWDDYFKIGEELEQKVKENTLLDLTSIEDGDLNREFAFILNLKV
jgi:hypothetical protein